MSIAGIGTRGRQYRPIDMETLRRCAGPLGPELSLWMFCDIPATCAWTGPS